MKYFKCNDCENEKPCLTVYNEEEMGEVFMGSCYSEFYEIPKEQFLKEVNE